MQILNYRISDRYPPPFKCFTQVEEISPKMADFIIKLHAEFPSDYHSANTTVHFSLPKTIQR